MSDLYQCSLCQGVFQTGWPDSEAMEEMKAHFGEVAPEDHRIVCDDCYQQMRQLDPEGPLK